MANKYEAQEVSLDTFLNAMLVKASNIQAKATLAQMEKRVYGSNGLVAFLNKELAVMGATVAAGAARTGNEGVSLQDRFAFAKGGFHPLSTGWKIRKKKAGVIGSLEANKFHLYSGALADSLTEANFPAALGKLMPKDVRITTKGGASARDEIDRYGRKVIRSKGGQFASVLDLEKFEVRFTLFPKLKAKVAPETLLFTDKTSGKPLAKLLNTNAGHPVANRPYRPIIGPYLRWYQTVKLPRLIKEFFNA